MTGRKISPETKTMCKTLAILCSLVLTSVALAGALPPEEFELQGVLRDAAGVPVHGARAINVHLYDAASAGNQILVDAHDSVPITNGLYRIAVGTGTIADGSGPGTYTALGDALRDFAEVWIELEVGDPVARSLFSKLAPRIKTKPVPFALNTKAIGSKPATSLLDTSMLAQTKAGALTVQGRLDAGQLDGDGAAVTEIDADTLDGRDSTGISLPGHTHDGSEITGSVPLATYAGHAASSLPADPPCSDNTNRFVDCGNGTVTDTATGLIWLKDANCPALWSGGPYREYAPANQAAAGLGQGACGLTDNSMPGDWRLPSRADWEALLGQAVANGCAAPRVPDVTGTGCCATGTCPFTGVQSEYYWSATSYAAGAGDAWEANLINGTVSINGKYSFDRVWPVRGGR